MKQIEILRALQIKMILENCKIFFSFRQTDIRTKIVKIKIGSMILKNLHVQSIGWVNIGSKFRWVWHTNYECKDCEILL